MMDRVMTMPPVACQSVIQTGAAQGKAFRWLPGKFDVPKRKSPAALGRAISQELQLRQAASA
jgi:hypothetical protein